MSPTRGQLASSGGWRISSIGRVDALGCEVARQQACHHTLTRSTRSHFGQVEVAPLRCGLGDRMLAMPLRAFPLERL